MYIFTATVTLTQSWKANSLIRISQSLTVAGNLPGKEDGKYTLGRALVSWRDAASHEHRTKTLFP